MPIPKRAALTWSLSMILLLLAPVAHAAEDLGLPAPPFASDTLRDDGSAMLTNPANLTFRPGVDAGLGVHATSALMQGDGAYGFVNYTAPFRLSIGLGVAARFGWDRGMTGFASLGWGAGPFAIALRYRVYQAAHHPMHGVSTSDIALTLRPTSFVSFSAVFTNLWTPKINATERLQRSYRLENGWRLSNGRFGAALQWTGEDIGFGYNHALAVHTEGRIARGWHIFASGKANVASANDRAAAVAPGFQVSLGFAMHTRMLGSDIGMHMVGADKSIQDVGASALLLYQNQPRESVVYPSGQLLKVSLSGRIPERPVRRLLGAQEKSLSDLLIQLRNVERSPQLDGVYLHLSGVKAGVAQLWELRKALDAIRERGRHVVVYIEEGGLRDLYLAASGDYIMASPAFVSQDAGLKIERFYIADLLKRFGIDATFVRVGEYKSAVETFTRSGPSEKADEALHAYMNDVWAVISRGLCENRPASACPSGRFPLHTLISAHSLYASRWINALGYEDELPQRLAQHFQRRLTPLSSTSVVDTRHGRWEPQARIAVLHISGALVGGKSGTNILTGRPFTGASSIETAAKQIRENRQVRGVIVRVNSPGGGLFASDEMHRALTLLQQSGLPIVFSFSDSAASGGYYVSSLPAPIYAAPTTATGSIGVYAGSFSIETLLNNLGVHRTEDSVGGPSKFYTTRAWDEDDIEWMQASIQHGYDRFRKLVAEGRQMTISEVETLAAGRIWSGKDAQTHGLIDHIGGFMDAYDALCDDIAACRRDPYAIEHYGQVVSLKLPFALASVLGVDSHAAGTKEIRAILEKLGLGSVFEPILTLAPTRSRETRADLGGVFRVTFE